MITAVDINIAEYIDQALLSPTATEADLKQCCHQGMQYNFASVCVYPHHVSSAVAILHSRKVKVSTVIGFPTGATTAEVKLYEAQQATERGAEELDVVINLGWLKDGETEKIHREISAIVEATGLTVKAILETTCLTDQEKRLGAEICLDAGVSFLKTSTGWRGGATVEDVRLLHEITRGKVGIKASGGIKTLSGALDLINAGATRLGTSRGADLVQQQKESVNLR